MENVNKSLKETCKVMSELYSSSDIHEIIDNISDICCDAIKKDNKIMLAGNGGSAADAQHIAGELVSRFMFDRSGLPAVALTTDTSIITAIGNDYGYDKIFSRQIQAVGCPEDVFFAYSTSGKSPNIIHGLIEAKSKNIITVGLSGLNESHNDMSKYCDYLIRIPSHSTPKIQEGHLVVGHIICGLIEMKIFG